MFRLGIWQLDRLNQRIEINQQKLSQFDATILELNAEKLNSELPNYEYRSVEVVGEFQHNFQVVLSNKVWNNRIGVHLLTPLKILGSDELVLINRGWISQEDSSQEDLWKFETLGEIVIHGIIRNSLTIPPLNMAPNPTLMPGQSQLESWVTVDLDRLGLQIPNLINIYVQETVKDNQDLPYVKEYDREVSEGPHRGYAIQWFIFAIIFPVGYIFLLRKQSKNIEENSISKKE